MTQTKLLGSSLEAEPFDEFCLHQDSELSENLLETR